MPSSGSVDPLRVVLGGARAGRQGPAVPRVVGRPRADVLDELGADGVLQLLVEGGANGRRRTSTGPAWSTAT